MHITACHRQEHQLKHKPQQAAQNQPTEAENKIQLLNYHM